MDSWILDPDAIAAEYATEEAYRDRTVGVRDLADGLSDEDVLRERLLILRPSRLLDVGAGLAELCVWTKAALGSDVVALDSSPRMIELAHRAGLPAVLADMRQLPFADGTFDCVVATMCLYHVPDPEAAIAEAARVLNPNGTLLATTGPDDDLERRHAWESLFHEEIPAGPPLSFSSENGCDLLMRGFSAVERIDCDSALVFTSRERLVRYLKALPRARDAADTVPELKQPFRLPSRATVFQATRPRQ
jgi:SAM-dependent methyltransferase